MSVKTTVVYAGPTISHLDVCEIIPEAELRPPVARGDLFKEDWTRHSTAVIIDGYFRERLSVGHKEILWLLNQGVHVFGGSSMGALRAAELYPYGMIGIGSIFDMYVEGEIDGDDEVAVLHGPSEIGYCALSAALVNIRYGCQEGARTGEVSPEIGAQIVNLAKARPFMHRGWENLKQELRLELHDGLTTIQRNIEKGVWNLKRLDSIRALDAARQSQTNRSKVPADFFTLSGITHHEALKWRTLRDSTSGKRMSDLDVLDAARLFDPTYPELHERVLTGLLTGFAETQGMEQASYTCSKLGIDETGPLPPSLSSWLSESELEILPRSEQLCRIIVRVWPAWQSTDWRPLVLEQMRKSSQWAIWNDTVIRADDAAKRRPVPNPPPEICGRLFLRHWGQQSASHQIEMARRGFYDIEDLGYVVQRFFALDVQETVGS